MKIIVSPGFGAGWSTWASGGSEVKKLLLSYPPLVEAVEKGGLGRVYWDEHPAIISLKEKLKEIGEDDYIYTGGLSDAVIMEVSEGVPFYISEYDGSETLHVVGDDEEFLTF